jgi:hypothetical protein
MNVRHVQRHRPASRDVPGFVEVALRALWTGALAGEKTKPSAGEETAGKVMLQGRAAKAGHGLGQVRSGKVKRSSGA